MIKRQHVVPNFFDEAEAMSEALDLRFKNPYTDTIKWHYFCDPRLYTYLRTSPIGVFPSAVFGRFMQRLRIWCVDHLGLVPMNVPHLHLMVNGCRLGLHSDFHNGTWGFVYSLTRWDNRRFSGGETLLLRDGVPSYKKHHVQGEVLYELVPAMFNQLLIFDDRIVHATPTIEGSMDPLEGRIALVGHIRATSPLTTGNLDPREARRVVLEELAKLRDRLKSYRDVQGTLTYRLSIDATGSIESATVLTDNVVTPITGYDHSDVVATVKSLIHQALTGLKFPAAAGESTVIVPVLIPLPDLRPIAFEVPHESSRHAIQERATRLVPDDDMVELRGSWEDGTYHVREPIAGTIRIESRRIVASFDPPMWVPSQRESFQRTLSEWLKTAWTEGVP